MLRGMDQVEIALGTMNFGAQLSKQDSEILVRSFLTAGYKHLDTAYVYNDGDTERIIAGALSGAGNLAPSIATKVSPRITGRLDEKSMTLQLEESLRRMGVGSVDILYLHFPDPGTKLEETLAACAKLQQRGLFRELGLSNYPAWQVVDAWHLCEENGWRRPTVYQGLYNALSRGVEEELLPALRVLGMRFFAYNPLAGGLLSGKYGSTSALPVDGRFSKRPTYRRRYWKQSFLDATEELQRACSAENSRLSDAAFRWAAFHSKLEPSAGDGILIGPSRVSHLDESLRAVAMGPLPSKIVAAFESAWALVKGDSPVYFRTQEVSSSPSAAEG